MPSNVRSVTDYVEKRRAHASAMVTKPSARPTVGFSVVSLQLFETKEPPADVPRSRKRIQADVYACI